MACNQWLKVLLVFVSVAAGCRLAAAEQGNGSTLKWVRCGESTSSPQKPALCGLGDDLVAEVDGLKMLQDDAAKAKRPIVLFLAGHPMRDLPYEHVPGDPNALSFRLVRTPDKENRALWSRVLGRPLARDPVVAVAVGLDDASSVANGGTTCRVEFPLMRSQTSTFVLLALAALVMALGVYVTGSPSLLRDSAFPPPNSGPAPYSLGRCQMAWWFFHITAAFVLIWAATGDIDTLTPQSLALMGISASTALFSTVIDSGKRATAQVAFDKARALAEDLEAQLEADPLNLQLQIRRNEAMFAYKAAKRTFDGPGESEAFLPDILTDVNGYAFHRLQVLVWTVLLTIVFWDSVWHDLAMPTFSDTLLALMGISSGTYLGFKFPEKQTQG